jgi:hypothetical protein
MRIRKGNAPQMLSKVSLSENCLPNDNLGVMLLSHRAGAVTESGTPTAFLARVLPAWLSFILFTLQ